jgi:phosphoglycerate kinase
MRTKTVSDLSAEEIAGQRILVRVDFNVPLDPQGRITDDIRITRALPTLEYLLERGGRVIVTSHLGRPKGKPDPAYSLSPVAKDLEQRLPSVAFVPHLVGPDAAAAVEDLEAGHLLLLENTRFHPGETKNDADLSRELGALGDVFVNDAFGAAHRAHASTVGVVQPIRERGGAAVAGLLMEREIQYLAVALESPRRPFVAVLGGAKISGKIDVIQALLPRVDRLLIGGAMANTFFRALGLETGESLVEEDRIEMARDALQSAEDRILLPVDCTVAREIREDAVTRTVERSEVGPGDRIGDIGPGTLELFRKELARAKTVVWNGPMGVFEMTPFSEGTVLLAQAVAEVTRSGGLTIVGGGDSASAAEQAGVVGDLSHVSTGGGASLELLAGRELPGLAVLDRSEEGAA